VKKFFTLLIGLSVLASYSTELVYAEEIEKINIVEPQADRVGWIYKIMNGKTYKRLYNYSKEEYEGPWILAL